MFFFIYYWVLRLWIQFPFEPILISFFTLVICMMMNDANDDGEDEDDNDEDDLNRSSVK